MKVTGKNILITGSNRGIGLAFAKQSAREKMHIHLLNRSRNQDVELELKNLGALSVTFWKIDLGSSQSIVEFTEKFNTSHFQCDILVNNAGQLTGGLLEEQPIEKITSMFQVNLIGLIHLTQSLLPQMLNLSEAKIVNNSSVSGLMYLPCASTYAASKAGVIAFTESLRNELEGTSVSTLVMVTPGVKTRMFDEIPELYSKHLDLNFLDSIPAEQWIDRVFDCIANDTAVCWPKGKSYVGVKMGQYLPGLFSKMVKPYFKR